MRGARLVAALVLALLAACATTEPEHLAPRHVGDPCFEVCPEGMVCTGTGGAGAAKTTSPGVCALAPNRCNVVADCHQQGAHCVGVSPNDVGFCAYGLPF
jgi:hypothetical protein